MIEPCKISVPDECLATKDCLDAALAGLDKGETVTPPAVEDTSLWEAFDATRLKMFHASQTREPASRYGL
jgi:uncharacterized protein